MGRIRQSIEDYPKWAVNIWPMRSTTTPLPSRYSVIPVSDVEEMIRITTWNVNGIRNPFSYHPWSGNRTFEYMFHTLDADIIVLQELKIQSKDITEDMVFVPDWDVHFSLPRHKNGYSGVAIYTRMSRICPIRSEEGITGILCPPKSKLKYRELPADNQIGGYPTPDQVSSLKYSETYLDSEGRCLLLEFPAFVLIGVYSPARADESRAEFALEFMSLLITRIRNLIALKKEVIVVGDLNITRTVLDSAPASAELVCKQTAEWWKAWNHDPIRLLFNKFLFPHRSDLVAQPNSTSSPEQRIVYEQQERRLREDNPVMWDLARLNHPTRKCMFTCWDTKRNGRPANYGTRIDYILCSDCLIPWFECCDVQNDLFGSDHCPVYGDFLFLLDDVNPEGMFSRNIRRQERDQSHILPLSGRSIFRFDRNQTIRDMFMKQPAAADAKQPSPRSSLASTSTDSTLTESEPVAGKKRLAGPDPLPDGIKRARSTASSLTVTSATATASEQVASFGNTSWVSEEPNRAATRGLDTQPDEDNDLPRGRTIKPEEHDASPIPSQSYATVSTTDPEISFTPRAGPAKAKSPDTQPDEGDYLPRGLTAQQPAPPDQSLKLVTLEELYRDLTPEPSTPAPSTAAPSAGPARASAGSQNTNTNATPIADGWATIFAPRPPPLCEHDESCISRVSKKPGIHCGRTFYACARPTGPTGANESGTQWSCGTFIWGADWRARGR